MLTPEQKYRLEMAKERTPSTSAFVWFVPVFLIIALLTKAAPEEVAQVAAYVVKDVPGYAPAVSPVRAAAQYDKYPGGDPLCGDKTICFLGWGL